MSTSYNRCCYRKPEFMKRINMSIWLFISTIFNTEHHYFVHVFKQNVLRWLFLQNKWMFSRLGGAFRQNDSSPFQANSGCKCITPNGKYSVLKTVTWRHKISVFTPCCFPFNMFVSSSVISSAHFRVHNNK